ncbi:hypothetical protein HI914_03520 [Erysiphe necator]|nr:hypothetical protein HI914_03520 [Erysiphe necator]
MLKKQIFVIAPRNLWRLASSYLNFTPCLLSIKVIVLFALMQAGLSTGCFFGETFGLRTSAISVERFGYRNTIIVSFKALIFFVNIYFLSSQSLVILLIVKILWGMLLGVFQTLSCACASGAFSMKLYPFLVTNRNLYWLIRQLLT